MLSMHLLVIILTISLESLSRSILLVKTIWKWSGEHSTGLSNLLFIIKHLSKQMIHSRTTTYKPTKWHWQKRTLSNNFTALALNYWREGIWVAVRLSSEESGSFLLQSTKKWNKHELVRNTHWSYVETQLSGEWWGVKGEHYIYTHLHTQHANDRHHTFLRNADPYNLLHIYQLTNDTLTYRF